MLENLKFKLKIFFHKLFHSLKKSPVKLEDFILLAKLNYAYLITNKEDVDPQSFQRLLD